jgi:hypothetical protein
MYIGCIPRILLLKKSQFHILCHILLTSAQILRPECRLVTARFVPMAIAARPITN